MQEADNPYTWLHNYWRAALAQDAPAMAPYFAPDAIIRWPNTNEQFTASEFIHVNCAYPDAWQGDILRCEHTATGAITVVHVYNTHRTISLHAVSFFTICHNLITRLEEYWAEDGPVPQWRAGLHIGHPITQPE